MALGVMARAPSAPGKSRLSADLSAARLATLCAALLADALDLLARCAAADRFVFYTPASADLSPFEATAAELAPQRGADLGERMSAALEDLIDCRGYDGAILIGTDSPLVTPQHIAEAAGVLRPGGVVLGPADDGGYYLIGMRQVTRELFTGIAWGTGTVLAETLRRAQRAGVEARLIRGAYDIDTIADLERIERDLQTMPPDVAPHVRRWLAGAEKA